MSYKRLTPCIFIDGGKAVQWFDDRTLLSDDVVSLAKQYCDRGADELIVFDLSTSDEEHDEAIDLIKKINRVISIPMIAGGNIRRAEDVKKILYAGAKRAILNFSKPSVQAAASDRGIQHGNRIHAPSGSQFGHEYHKAAVRCPHGYDGAERDPAHIKMRRHQRRVRSVHQQSGYGFQRIQRDLCRCRH